MMNTQPKQQDGINRREFLVGAAAILGVAAYGACDGASRVYFSEQEATRLHPRERETYNSLKVISGNISGAIEDLDYTASRTELVTYIDPDGDIQTKTVYHPAKYPKPKDAKAHLEGALKEYRGVSPLVFSENNFQPTLQGVYEKLPDEEIIRENREVFEKEMKLLNDALNKCNSLESKYDSIIHREVKDKIMFGIVEAILGVIGIPVGIFLALKSRRDRHPYSYY